MAAGDAFEFREIDRVIVVGQTHPETVFEIIGRAGELTPRSSSTCWRAMPRASPTIARAAGMMRARRSRPRWMRSPATAPRWRCYRVEHFQVNPPAVDWDGAWRLEQK